MNVSRKIIDASYALCRRLSRRSGSNFYLGFFLLPHQKRQAMYALYAFMRHTDDLVDAAPTGQGRGFNTEIGRQKEQLHNWRTMLENALAGISPSSLDLGPMSMKPVIRDSNKTSPLPLGEGLGVRAFASNKRVLSEFLNGQSMASAEILLPALVDTVEKYHIPADCLYAVLDGVEMDLDRRRYQTFDELKEYCLRVASAVGLACIHVWGFRGQGTPQADAALKPARQAGVALQLTNILRDLKADAAADRVYLPLEDLHSCGYTTEELKNGVVNNAFCRLMELEIDRARQFYQQGANLFDFLNRDGRRIFGLMTAVYRRLLEKIARRPGDVFARPIRIGKFNRLALFLYWTLFPSFMAEKKTHTAANGAP